MLKFVCDKVKVVEFCVRLEVDNFNQEEEEDDPTKKTVAKPDSEE